MSATILDGKITAAAVFAQLAPRIEKLKSRDVVPGLAAVLVGDNPASSTYVNSKAKACEKLGLYSEVVRKPGGITQAELVDIVRSLNNNPRIHGILVQSPLPSHMDELTVTLAIAPEKDVDGFHPHNVGMMLIGRSTLLPCTPAGIIRLLAHYHIETAGKEAVIIGRSNIVGKPIAALLMQKGKTADATVTVAHSRTPNLKEVTKRADIVIAAIGKPNTVTADMVKDGVVVVDVGINRIDDSSSAKGYRIVGDVDFDAVAKKSSAITPVPGGVGQMTIALLMENTVMAAENQSAR